MVEGEEGEGVAVAGEVGEEVPARRIDVGTAEVFGEGGVVVGEEGIEGFVVEEGLLLDYLGVDVGGAERFDGRDKVVSYSLYCLSIFSIPPRDRGGTVRGTLLVKLSSRGLISDTDLTTSVAFSLSSMIFDRFSSSARAFNQFSSIGPSEIARTTAGDMETSSTAGPSSFSTTLRFSNLVFRAVDRDCSVSISADT